MKRIPVIGPALRGLRHHLERKQLENKHVEQVFAEFYASNRWGDNYSRSGGGSNLTITGEFRRKLPEVWRQLGARSILDIPCGDFKWMKEVELRGFQYTGADIVDAIIGQNLQQHAQPHVTFRRLDLLKDSLPETDLVFCRDCLVHFSFDHIRQALLNVKASGARWLMMTEFPKTEINEDILTGQWRPLNFDRAPFCFPPPHAFLPECSDPELAGLFRGRPDKRLTVWAVSDLPHSF